MLKDNKLLIGKNSEKELYLLPKMANRHGIITGASGSGKTTTLKVMAESMSEAGIPVFLVDIKGDLAATSQVGVELDFIKDRIESLELTDFEYKKYPVTFFDVFGKNGHPIRTTVQNIGPRLLSKMLDLSDSQEGILSIVFQIAEDEELELIDLKDLKSILTYVGENRKDYSLKYGNITVQSIGAIQRSLLILEQDGGELFFGSPSFDLEDLISYGDNNYGTINILDSQELFKKPTLYATFLIWILNEIYNTFPEVGDLDRPKLALFFDEAHLMFSEMPNYVIKQITQIVKLIRSKGVGIYFISQCPSDVPDEVLAQLGNKIQHVLRGYTKADQNNIKAAANSFRSNPSFKTENEIQFLKTGEALISFLNEKGEPEIVEKAYILPPTSKTGTITDSERQRLIVNNRLYYKYYKEEDEVSAYEKIEEKNKKASEEKIEEEKKKVAAKEKEANKKKTDKTVSKYSKKLANKTVNTLGRKIGNELFKMLFK